MSEVEKLKDLAIPRSFGLKNVNEQVEMHVFVDTSMICYGAVAYFVRMDKEVVWVAARSRVLPEKIGDTDVGGSVPRLELQSEKR